jgi:hypothetical protein
MREVVTNLREVTILKGIGHWTQQEAAVDTNTALRGSEMELDCAVQPRALGCGRRERKDG